MTGIPRSTHVKALLFLFVTFSSVSAFAALESNAAIPSGTADGRGPLAADAVSEEPVGVACVFGAAEPDLFLATGQHGRHRGLFLYAWSGRGPHGEPVFSSPQPVAFPFKDTCPPCGHILQTDDGVVHGLWLQDKEIVHTVFDRANMRFDERNRIRLEGLPRDTRQLVPLINPDGTAEMLLEVGDGVRYRPAGVNWRDPAFVPYDGRGMWRGGLPYVGIYAVTLPAQFEGPAGQARLVSATEREVRMQLGRMAVVDLGDDRTRDIITGSLFGPFYYYHNSAKTGVALDPKAFVVDEHGIARRHPQIHGTPVAYRNPVSGRSDLLVGGEGGLYWYRFSGTITEAGCPLYDTPRPVLEEKASLYAGSLPVTNCVDWDGDGDKDIIAGNSDGLLNFFENAGNNTEPRFLPGQPLEADGHIIHIQPGYRLDIQGPSEARWGYTCPTVVDWNQDGVLDVLLGDSTARHTVFLNEGTPTSPRLARGEPLYFDGLDMFGMWRVQPAVGLMGGRMAYITLDQDDELHLYWQVDPRNITEGFKLRTESGAAMRGNYLDGGGTGRLKLVLYDWDRDGIKDLIVGTPRHASVPDPQHGLPKSLGRPGSAVLFVKNVGSETTPAFAFPQLFGYRGKPLYFGQHACGPAVADFGQANGPGLIVGEEGGRIFYYDHEDLSLFTPDFTKREPLER